MRAFQAPVVEQSSTRAAPRLVDDDLPALEVLHPHAVRQLPGGPVHAIHNTHTRVFFAPT